jgi:Cation transporting ATPase, C-terminus
VKLAPEVQPWRLHCCLQVLHVMILYVPWAAALFSVTALSGADWAAVLWLSAPVVLLDECLKVRPLPCTQCDTP